MRSTKREEARAMDAKVGDRVVVPGHHVGDLSREGVIVEVHGEDGGPPYLVRWSDGHEGMFFPGSDTSIEHAAAPPRRG
jgi:hypothetical protein